MSPATSASTAIEATQHAPPQVRPGRLVSIVDETPWRTPPVESDPVDELADAVLEIELGYRRRLAGLRGMPGDRRAAAIRAAGEWRAGALKALKERRVSARHGRRQERRLRREAQRPAPPWERRRQGENNI